MSCSASRPVTTSSTGWSESRPATGSGSSPTTAPSRATTIPPPISCSRTAHTVMSASATPTITTLCASWATVEANAPARRPNPRTSPRPIRPVAWWRSTTAILARSRAGSATTRPSATGASSSRASVISCPGTVSITRTRADSAAMANASAARGADRIVRRTNSGIGGRENGSARPSDATSRPSFHTRAGRNVSRSSSSTRSARRPGAIAPRSSRPCARAGCSVAMSSASSAATPSSTAIRHIWSMCPSRYSRSGSRSSVQNAQCCGPYCFTSGSRSRRLWAFDASRISTHIPRWRFSSASANVVAS